MKREGRGTEREKAEAQPLCLLGHHRNGAPSQRPEIRLHECWTRENAQGSKKTGGLEEVS